MNFSLFAPFTMDSLPGVSPLRPVGNTASFAGFASRPVHSIVVPSPFLVFRTSSVQSQYSKLPEKRKRHPRPCL